MALITCKKCKRIVASGNEPCPYCGEAHPGDTQIDSDPKQGRFRYLAIGLFVLTLLSIVLVQCSSRNDKSSETQPGQASETDAAVDAVSSIKSTCLSSDCPAGTKAVTNTTRQEPFYSCKSNELSEYANFVLSVMITQVQHAGISPEISSKTGEPVVQGSDKSALDQYREKAGVSSFEEAISKCYRGEKNLKVLVLYSPKESNSLYVAAEENQENKFWMPKAKLIRKSH